MKARNSIKILFISILGLLLILTSGVKAQEEYDDMYFTPKDRKEIKTESINVPSSTKKSATDADKKEVINPSYSTQLYGNVDENYSSKNVNPEYIERYKVNSKDSASDEELTEGDAYYVENYDRSNILNENLDKKSISQYGYPGSYYGYNDPWARYNYYGRSFYDPFYSPYYGSGWGFTPGISLSLSFGSGWGYNPWYSPYSSWGYPGYYGYYNPWYSRYYYNPYAYDPWYGPNYYSPYYRYGLGYASSYYYSGFYNGYYNGYYVGSGDVNGNINRYKRRATRGSDNYVVKDEIVPNRRTAVSQERPSGENQSINNRARTTRDYSRTQNEYYTRSRYNNGSTSTSSSVNTRNSRNTVGTTSTPRVRSSRSGMDYSRPTYRNTTGARSSGSYNSGSYNRSSSSYYNSGTQRSRTSSSYSGSRSYSSGSSGSRSYSGSSAPSRSSSGSSGSRSSSSGRGQR